MQPSSHPNQLRPGEESEEGRLWRGARGGDVRQRGEKTGAMGWWVPGCTQTRVGEDRASREGSEDKLFCSEVPLS